jgi:hypothetical protein
MSPGVAALANKYATSSIGGSSVGCFSMASSQPSTGEQEACMLRVVLFKMVGQPLQDSSSVECLSMGSSQPSTGEQEACKSLFLSSD